MIKKLLFFFCLTVSVLHFSQQWSISFAERNVLVSFYNSTSGDQWSQKWDFTKDPRNWYGVKIKNGAVIELNLRGNALKGSFPSSISGLSKLQKLDLSSNQLVGEVSPALASLGNLVRLDISNNRLTGDPTAFILPLSKLTELSVGNNQFQFADINAVLQSFPNLKILDIAHIGLTAAPQKFSSLNSLESLNLSNNAIQNFSSISSLIKLTELNISGNQLTKIPAEVGSLISLTTLDLSNNLFSTNYSAALSNLKSLEWLSLQNNQINAFPAELMQLSKLVHLNFAGNKISDGFQSLRLLKNLEQIYLDKNLITAFPETLLQLRSLQMLSLTGNQLSGSIPANIPALTFLDNNRYTREDIRNFILQNTKKTDFTYSPQRYDEEKTVTAALGSSVSLPQSLSGNNFQFTWFKNLDQKTPATTESYFISKVEETDFTSYTCEAYYFEKLPEALMELAFYREPVSLVKDLGTSEANYGLVVYPNPTSDFLNIKTSKLDIEKVYIFDLSGKLIMTETAKIIDVKHLPSASYVISIKTSEGLQSFKFIKK